MFSDWFREFSNASKFTIVFLCTCMTTPLFPDFLCLRNKCEFSKMMKSLYALFRQWLGWQFTGGSTLTFKEAPWLFLELTFCYCFLHRNFDAWGCKFHVFARKVMSKSTTSRKLIFPNFGVDFYFFGSLGSRFSCFLVPWKNLKQIDFWCGNGSR